MLTFLVVIQMSKRLAEVMSRHETAKSTLAELLRRRPMYTQEYFAAQWARQKELQSKAISQSVKDRTERLEVLLRLEEELLDAR